MYEDDMHISEAVEYTPIEDQRTTLQLERDR